MRLIYFLVLISFCSLSSLRADDEDILAGSGSVSILPPGVVFEGRYFGTGEVVELSGVVHGNAYLMGSQVIVSGEVEGDLIAIGATVVITGKVRGNVKLVAGQGDIAGDIRGNLEVLGININMMPQGRVGGSVFFAGGYGEIDNTIAGNATVLAGGLKVAGTLEKNLQTFVGRLNIKPTAVIDGNLKYRSGHVALIDSQARIGGQVLYKQTLFKDAMDMPVLRRLLVGSKVATFLMNFFYTFVVGVVFIRMFPKRLKGTLFVLQHHTWKCGYYGLFVLMLLPLISIILLISVIGAPFALTLMALNLISFYTVKVFAILSVSNFLFAKIGWQKNKIPALAAGQILYYLVVLIPGIGWVIAFSCMVFGLGASVVKQVKRA